MAVIYPQIDSASNPPTIITTPRLVGTTGDGTKITRAGLESFFDAAGRKGGIMGTVLSMPSVQQQFTDKIFGSDADLVEYQPTPRVPLTPPPSYEPGVDPMFNYFEGQTPPDVVIMGENERGTVDLKEGSKGLVGEAKRVQQQGRNGDTMLVHMNPDEYNAMVQLGGLGGLVQNGVTINPETGLPEMFSFKNILPTLVGVAGAAFGLPTWAVALGTGAPTAITTGDIGKGILAGLGSYALGSLFGDVGASGVSDTAATQAATGAGSSAGTQAAMNVPPPINPANAPQVLSDGAISGVGSRSIYEQAAGLSASQPLGPLPFDSAFNAPPSPGFDPFGSPPPLSAFGAPSPEFNVGGIGSPVQAPPPSSSLTPVAERIGAGRGPLFDPPPVTPEALAAARTSVFEQAPLSTTLDSTAVGPSKLELFGEGLSKIGEPGGVSYLDAATKGLGGLGATAGGMGLFDEPTYDYSGFGGRRRYSGEPIAPLNRTALSPDPDYRPGIDPAFNYFAAQDGKRGELDPSTGGIMGGNVGNAIAQSAQQIASNAAPMQMRLNPAMYSANAAVRAALPMRRMANGGVPEEQAMAGLMDVASDQVKNNLEERMSVPPQDSEPQNVEERIVYDNAMLAVQGVLEDEAAQEAISDFIETFGMAAYEALVASVNEPRDEGGVIKPANGETTVQEGAIQGEDVIAGMIVDPETGEESANLRIGENEYVEPAESLTRRAMAAGLPPTPKNGAMVRSAEEDQLRMAYG